MMKKKGICHPSSLESSKKGGGDRWASSGKPLWAFRPQSFMGMMMSMKMVTMSAKITMMRMMTMLITDASHSCLLTLVPCHCLQLSNLSIHPPQTPQPSPPPSSSMLSSFCCTSKWSPSFSSLSPLFSFSHISFSSSLMSS